MNTDLTPARGIARFGRRRHLHSTSSRSELSTRPAVNRDDGRGSGYRSPGEIRLGHVHLKVRSLHRSLPFYTALLGLEISARTGHYAFLAAGTEHHSIALEEIGDWAPVPERRALGMAHLAFEVPNCAAFFRRLRTLSDADIPYISGNYGISWAVRLQDPDGHEIEIFVDRRCAREEHCNGLGDVIFSSELKILPRDRFAVLRGTLRDLARGIAQISCRHESLI